MVHHPSSGAERLSLSKVHVSNLSELPGANFSWLTARDKGQGNMASLLLLWALGGQISLNELLNCFLGLQRMDRLFL
jgi:hypothetical protein